VKEVIVKSMPVRLRNDYSDAFADYLKEGFTLQQATRRMGLRLLRQKKLETYRIAFLQVGNVRYGMTLWEDAWEEGYPVADKLTENDKLRLLVS